MGICECVQAPMGDKGLEGFILGDKYEWGWDWAQESRKKKLYFVHLNDVSGSKGVMTKATFKKYFKKIIRQKNSAENAGELPATNQGQNG